jgi:hypothetical protein
MDKKSVVMLSVINTTFMLSAVMLNAIMLSEIMPSVVALITRQEKINVNIFSDQHSTIIEYILIFCKPDTVFTTLYFHRISNISPES